MRKLTKHATEDPKFPVNLMEEILSVENLKRALKQVCGNKGSAGIDGLTVEELPNYLKLHWTGIKAELLVGVYKPQSVRRVEIPKNNGGVRKLGIPTVLDRFIQQALAHVLSKYYDPSFSTNSYGFRPKRSAHQAVIRAKEYQQSGNRIVVDIDLEKFFDRVNHDRLMSKLARDIHDRRVIKLIRSYLNAGVMENGIVKYLEEGTPQGGPLSPLLSNIVLDELDKELESRNLKFVRYADDCNIYVKSNRAGNRVMASISKFIWNRLRLTVNQEKSSVTSPSKTKFLGFIFTSDEIPKIQVSPESILRMKDKIREITGARRESFLQTVDKIKTYLTGWKGYYGLAQIPSVFAQLDSWIRHRLRCQIWQHWRKYSTRYKKLVSFGVRDILAKKTASSGKGAWHLSGTQALHIAFPISYFDKFGIPRLAGNFKPN
jgi:RNA-directed DNA polymerase